MAVVAVFEQVGAQRLDERWIVDLKCYESPCFLAGAFPSSPDFGAVFVVT
jgi:hypothetical protein